LGSVLGVRLAARPLTKLPPSGRPPRRPDASGLLRRLGDVTRPPTDFELLQAIYERHRDEFNAYVEDAPNRQTKIMVPIDVPAIADELGVDPDSVFGRLYFHLDPKYGEEPDAEGRRKAFFDPFIGEGDPNAVNFPLLEAVLAGLWQQRDRDLWTFWLAVVSIVIAVGSLAVSIVVAATA
jgi:hypothetical protein